MAQLAELEVLVVDCQTTSSSPATGHLLEVAWCLMRVAGGAEPNIESHLVAPPEGVPLPPRVARLTGIRADDLAAAAAAADVRGRLAATAGLADLAVAHVARFETAFLGPLPVRTLCTHEIAIRLLPDLPRRGLRALAGYLGHPVAEHKRAGDHVRATVVVWRELVARLGVTAGVSTLDELDEWLAATTPARRGGRGFPLQRQRRLALPEAPGVYRMLGKQGDVLYVGKAASLRRRVNSYFQKRRPAVERTMELLTAAHDLDVTVTGSPLEAALLETDEIKRLSPPFNVALKGGATHVWFATADLQDVASTPGPAHVLGPAGERDALLGLSLVWRLLRGEEDPADPELWQRLLWVPEPFPAPEVLAAGYGLFRAGLELETAADLLTHGEALRDEPEADEEEPVDEPEEVARRLRGIVVHGALTVRRGAWLCDLAESSLAWQVPGGQRHRHLVLARGRIQGQGDWPAAVSPPPPAGRHRDRLTRQRDFDRSTFDRLRVLSTELRRLVAAETWLALRTDDGEPLDREAVAARLA